MPCALIWSSKGRYTISTFLIPRSSALKDHLRLHETFKAFMCRHCSLRFQVCQCFHVFFPLSSVKTLENSIGNKIDTSLSAKRNQLPRGLASNSSRGISWGRIRPRCTQTAGRSSAACARRSCSIGSRYAITSWCTPMWSRSSVRSARRGSSGRVASGHTWSFTPRTRLSSATFVLPSLRGPPCWKPTSWRTLVLEGSSATSASTGSI